MIEPAIRATGRRSRGFTLVELVTVTAVIGIVSAIAIPSFNAIYERSCVMAAVSEITGMIKEAKHIAFADGRYFSVGFDPGLQKVTLISGRGPDGDWNTADDQVVRSLLLADKRGGIHFGYGSYGPRDGLAAAPDGIAVPNNNTMICSPELTGNAGTVYLISRSGSAMAITVNRTDFGYSLWRWNGEEWVQI